MLRCSVVNLSKIILLLYVLNFIIFTPIHHTLAESDVDNLEDGAYSIEYVILHAETDSASIANDYFEKPATLYVEGDERFIQFALNHSQWTKELQAPSGDDFVDVDVISVDEEEDIRVVEFELDRDLSEPIEFKMHVLIEEMEPVYDHRYTVRFDFDESSMELIEDAPERPTKMEEEGTEDKEEEAAVAEASQDNNNDSTNMIVWISIVTLVVFVIILFVLFIRKKQKKVNLEDR